MSNDDLSLPDDVVAELPEDLRGSVTIAGGESVPPMSDVKLFGSPGTGKSMQLDARATHLIDVEGVRPENILRATYRRDLAADMSTRLLDWGVLNGASLEEDTRLWGTVHSVAYQLTDLVTRENDTEIVDQDDRREFCKEVIDKPYDSSVDGQDGVGCVALDELVWLHQNLIDPVTATREQLAQCHLHDELTSRWPGVNVARVERLWNEYKSLNALVDYHELLEAALNVPAPGVTVAQIDEYHDVYPLMARLAEKWLNAAEIGMVAGDPDQVVNAYSGSSPVLWDRIQYPEVLLKETYRVGEESWRAANFMLAKAPDHSPKPVNRTTVGEIREFTVPEITKKGDEWVIPDPTKSGSPSRVWQQYGPDIMFLTRTRAQATAICEALEFAGIPHTSQTRIGGWQRDWIRHIYNALAVIRPYSSTDFKAKGGRGVADVEQRDPSNTQLRPGEAAALLRYTPSRYLSVNRSQANENAKKLAADEIPVSLSRFNEDYAETRFWDRMTAGPASVENIVHRSRFGDREETAVRRLLQARGTPLPVDATGRVDIDTQVLTIHASKGSEADHVVLFDGVTRKIKNRMEESRSEKNNEYRTWYVGLTRASECMHVARGWADHVEWIEPILPDDLVRQARAPVTGGEQA